MTILPAAYLGSVGWFARALGGGATVDAGEHFVKRTERNRARILGAEGVMELSVPVVRANHPGTPMREVRVDDSLRWRHRHWEAIRSAYGAAPYFAHYRDRFEPFYRRRWDFLLDLDMELTALLAELLGGAMPLVSEAYIEASPDDLDLRGRRAVDPDLRAAPYIQAFADRLPFVAGLSVVDLLFAEGPAAGAVLRESIGASDPAGAARQSSLYK